MIYGNKSNIYQFVTAHPPYLCVWGIAKLQIYWESDQKIQVETSRNGLNCIL